MGFKFSKPNRLLSSQHAAQFGVTPIIDSVAAGNSMDAAGSPAVQVTQRNYTTFALSNDAWYGMLVLAIFLLTFCALLAGLTLGVCGLDITWLQLRSVSGTVKQRQQALVVARMKRHGSWMLCSLILCSVACGESLPIIIQILWSSPAYHPWIAILISTLSIAIFAELIPQHLIPRKAIAWGYYCWPVIWGCMWLTAIISFPLGWLLDRICGAKDTHGIFTNEQLAAVIKYHELSEKRGGNLGQDATRVMLGALHLDSRRIGGPMTLIPERTYHESEMDLEKAELDFVHGLIVNWSAVKTVNISEPINEEFIKKVIGWSYSRIPVIGKSAKKLIYPDEWEGTKIYGFLHIKNLVGIDSKTEGENDQALLVKDLPLYPLPIVKEDTTVYELLNMFQLGISRMAVIVAQPLDTYLDQVNTPSRNTAISGSAAPKGPLWTSTTRSARIVGQIKDQANRIRKNDDWSSGYLKAAQANIGVHSHRVVGIRSPKPIGIVTFEDLIDTILQKTSSDEKDFFDRGNLTPPTKTRKVGDYICGFTADSTPILTEKADSPCKPSTEHGTLRKRKVSKNQTQLAMDGANDQNHEETSIQSIKLPKKSRNIYIESSYTQNSRGGLHGESSSDLSFGNAILLTPQEIANLMSTSSLDHPGNLYSKINSGTLSLPSRKGKIAIMPEDLTPFGRHTSAEPRIPNLRRISPFSRYKLYASSEEMVNDPAKGDLIVPSVSEIENLDIAVPMEPQMAHYYDSDIEEAFQTKSILEDAKECSYEGSGDTITLSSWYGDSSFRDLDDEFYSAYPIELGLNNHGKDCLTICEEESPNTSSAEVNVDNSNEGHIGTCHEISLNSRLAEIKISTKDKTLPSVSREEIEFTMGTSNKDCDGFPEELLDLDSDKENRVPNYASKTLPRMARSSVAGSEFDGTSIREKNIQDDRDLLPSPSKTLNNVLNIDGTRSSSLWF